GEVCAEGLLDRCSKSHHATLVHTLHNGSFGWAAQRAVHVPSAYGPRVCQAPTIRPSFDKLGTRNLAFLVVDVREMAAFNGWTLHSNTRGGHIRGAVAFPLEWTAVVKGTALQRLFASHGIT